MLVEGSSVSSFASTQIICGVVNTSKFKHEMEKKKSYLTFHYISAAAIIRTRSK